MRAKKKSISMCAVLPVPLLVGALLIISYRPPICLCKLYCNSIQKRFGNLILTTNRFVFCNWLVVMMTSIINDIENDFLIWKQSDEDYLDNAEKKTSKMVAIFGFSIDTLARRPCSYIFDAFMFIWIIQPCTLKCFTFMMSWNFWWVK